MYFKKIAFAIYAITITAIVFTGCSQNSSTTKFVAKTSDKKTESGKKTELSKKSADTAVDLPVSHAPINHAQYDSLMKKLAVGDSSGKWPVKNAPYPLPGAILPYKRVVAFYGNLYSKGMGI